MSSVFISQSSNESLKVFFSENPVNISGTPSLIALVKQALSCYTSTLFPKGFALLTQNLEVIASDNSLTITFDFPFPCASEWSSLAQALTEHTKKDVSVNVNLLVEPVRQHNLVHIKNIVAVASGKGGVGKSTTTVNLAYALMKEGAKVGVLDADIYGPSIPTLLGLKDQQPTPTADNKMTPLYSNGVAAMSIGFLMDPNDATVWRGPMASRAFSQLLNDTQWPELDYLLIDMPPGTGDIQLTLAQQVPVAAAVIVTTPQDIAMVDAIKGIAMFEKVTLPVLGIVENMSYHVCDNCGHHSHIFGQEGGQDIADIYKTPLLGQLPLNIDICQDADLGKSIVLENSTSDISLQYRKIAQNVAAELFEQLDMRSATTAELSIINKTIEEKS